MSKDKILERYRNQIAQKIPLTGSGAGTGLSAKCAELGGADMIIVYNSGWFRMAGGGSSSGRLSFSDANSIILDLQEMFCRLLRRQLAAYRLPILTEKWIDIWRKQELGLMVFALPTVGNPS